MFQFGRFALVQLAFSQLGSPIRKSADLFACADPRGLSQLVASFIASESLGIPRVLLFTFFVQNHNHLPVVCRPLSNNFFQYVKELPPSAP